MCRRVLPTNWRVRANGRVRANWRDRTPAAKADQVRCQDLKGKDIEHYKKTAEHHHTAPEADPFITRVSGIEIRIDAEGFDGMAGIFGKAVLEDLVDQPAGDHTTRDGEYSAGNLSHSLSCLPPGGPVMQGIVRQDQDPVKENKDAGHRDNAAGGGQSEGDVQDDDHGVDAG